MAQSSEIEWTDATWNPVTGCTKVGPGCDNCYAERFAERFRDELLNETLFSTMREAREAITAWQEDYNQQWPHSSLGNLTPQEFAMKSRPETQAA